MLFCFFIDGFLFIQIILCSSPYNTCTFINDRQFINTDTMILLIHLFLIHVFVFQYIQYIHLLNKGRYNIASITHDIRALLGVQCRVVWHNCSNLISVVTWSQSGVRTWVVHAGWLYPRCTHQWWIVQWLKSTTFRMWGSRKYIDITNWEFIPQSSSRPQSQIMHLKKVYLSLLEYLVGWLIYWIIEWKNEWIHCLIVDLLTDVRLHVILKYKTRTSTREYWSIRNKYLVSWRHHPHSRRSRLPLH